MNIRPLGDRVVVKPLLVKDGEIIVIAARESKPVRGEVISVGPGRMELGKRIEMPVKVGDRVLHAEGAGTAIPNSEYLIMREYEIFAIMEN